MKLFAKIGALAVMGVTASALAQPAPPPPPPAADNEAPGEYQSPPPPPPTAMPSPPPAAMPPPVASGPAPQAAPPPPMRDGEWVYTSQYGYVWMPYGQSYTYVAGNSASMYVFWPHYGWRWVSAPWVVGVGPAPRWRYGSPVRFAWYAHPWFRPRARVYYGRHPRAARRW
jgi:hypothetical protein